jgi:hypothetical protein
MRALTAEERGMRYMHAFDKNWMYISACSGLKLGFGKPEHITGGHDAWDGRPGYWLVTPGSRIANEWAMLPPMISERAQRSWVSTPTVEVALEQYTSLVFRDAWVYPEYHNPLTAWARRLKAARETLRDSNPVAYGVLKSCYSQAIGWLGLNKLKDGTEPVDLYRPDWRHAIIATARANMYRNVAKAYQASGIAPFAIATDCLYYVTDSICDAGLFASKLGLRLGDAVGEYKIAHAAIPLSDVRDCIELGGSAGLTALQKRLKGAEDEAGDSSDAGD